MAGFLRKEYTLGRWLVRIEESNLNLTKLTVTSTTDRVLRSGDPVGLAGFTTTTGDILGINLHENTVLEANKPKEIAILDRAFPECVIIDQDELPFDTAEDGTRTAVWTTAMLDACKGTIAKHGWKFIHTHDIDASNPITNNL